MSNKKVFVEQRPEGDFAVRKPSSKRASAVEPTQADAIARTDQSMGRSRCRRRLCRRQAVGMADPPRTS
jgi:hypothetical protein